MLWYSNGTDNNVLMNSIDWTSLSRITDESVKKGNIGLSLITYPIL